MPTTCRFSVPPATAARHTRSTSRPSPEPPASRHVTSAPEHRAGRSPAGATAAGSEPSTGEPWREARAAVRAARATCPPTPCQEKIRQPWSRSATVAGRTSPARRRQPSRFTERLRRRRRAGRWRTVMDSPRSGRAHADRAAANRDPPATTHFMAQAATERATVRHARAMGESSPATIAMRHHSARSSLCNHLARCAKLTATHMFWHLLVAAIVKWITR